MLVGSIAPALAQSKGEEGAADKRADQDREQAPKQPPEKARDRPPEQDAPGPTAEDVYEEPPPGFAHGMLAPDPSRKPSMARRIGRVALFVPKLLVSVIAAPIRQTLVLYDRHYAGGREFGPESGGSFNFYPVLRGESGYGLTAGLKTLNTSVFGDGEVAMAEAMFLGRLSHGYRGRVTSGQRLGPFQLIAEGQYERRDEELFFGIGNRDAVGFDDAAGPIDPFGTGPAPASRYRQHFGRAFLGGSLRLAAPLEARVGGAMIVRRHLVSDVDDEGDPIISDAYDTGALPGFDAGVTQAYGQAELRFDNRRPVNRFRAGAWPSAGLLSRVYGGYAQGVEDDDSSFGRLGFELAAPINLYDGSRVLLLRFAGEGVTDPAAQVPFSELPRLGGRENLRGYVQGRFRDRYAASATAEYQWQIVPQLLRAQLFADAGRVANELDVDWTDQMAIGFGGGLYLDRGDYTRLSLTLASSRDGGFFVGFALDPVPLSNQFVTQ